VTLRGSALAVLSIGLLVSACDAAARTDAATVVSAVSRFRSADNGSLPAMVSALKATPCTSAEACQARDVCVASGESTAAALRLRADVEKSLADLESGRLSKDAPEASELPKKLDEATTLLKQGYDGLVPCDERVQGLKRKYRI
jgi:hypothetical protein